jgi:hypothetical protein
MFYHVATAAFLEEHTIMKELVYLILCLCTFLLRDSHPSVPHTCFCETGGYEVRVS